MSDINLRRFVDINIAYHVKSNVSSIRDTAALLTLESAAPHSPYASYEEFLVDFPEPTGSEADSHAVIRAYASVFFDNDGNKLAVIPVASVGSADIANAISGLANEIIVVALASADNAVQSNYLTLKGVAETRAADATIYGINEKVIVARSELTSDTDKVKNFAVKYSNTLGAEMTIAAYLTNIDFDGTNTILDYMYTKEVLTAEQNDDAVLAQALDNNYNVVMKLAQKPVNLGGNLKDGASLINHFSLIVLQQVLTDRLIELLLSKLKGNNGIASIQSEVSSEMTRWLTNGYLDLDKVWTDQSLKVTKNNKTYTIIEKDTPLVLGYKFVVLPMSSLTAEEITAKKAPAMYLILADSYGIRKVTINGEVI